MNWQVPIHEANCRLTPFETLARLQPTPPHSHSPSETIRFLFLSKVIRSGCHTRCTLQGPSISANPGRKNRYVAGSGSAEGGRLGPALTGSGHFGRIFASGRRSRQRRFLSQCQGLWSGFTRLSCTLTDRCLQTLSPLAKVFTDYMPVDKSSKRLSQALGTNTDVVATVRSFRGLQAPTFKANPDK